MQQVKAYMSESLARQSALGWAVYSRNESIASQAVREARAILAETEPATVTYGRGTTGCYALADQLYVRASHPFVGEAGRALAESLAAFVAMEIG